MNLLRVKVAVIGLGSVESALAVEFGDKNVNVLGF